MKKKSVVGKKTKLSLKAELDILKSKIVRHKRTLVKLRQQRQRLLYISRQPLRDLSHLEAGYRRRISAHKQKLLAITAQIRKEQAAHNIGFVNPYSSISLSENKESELRLQFKSNLAKLSAKKPLRCVNVSDVTLKALGYTPHELLNYCGVPICVNNSVKDMEIVVLADDINVIHTRSWEPDEIDNMMEVDFQG